MTFTMEELEFFREFYTLALVVGLAFFLIVSAFVDTVFTAFLFMIDKGGREIWRDYHLKKRALDLEYREKRRTAEIERRGRKSK